MNAKDVQTNTTYDVGQQKKKSHYRVHTLCFQSFQSFILESAVSIVMEMVWFSSCDLLFQSHDSSSGPCDRNCK